MTENDSCVCAMATLIIFSLLCFVRVTAAQYFDATSCTGLKVKSSGTSISAQPPSTIPITIEVTPSPFYVGSVLNVIIRAKDDSRNTFQGIMLQVRQSKESSVTYGTWGFSQNAGLTFLPCLGSSLGTIINANNEFKTLPQSLAWISPPDPQLSSIQIIASFVEEADIFWENLPMIEVQMIEDTTPPVIDENTCPIIVSSYILPGETSRSVTWDEPTATDDSGTVMTNRSHDPGDVFPTNGGTVVLYTFSDLSGNIISCAFIVVFLQDTEPPVVECPDDVTAKVNAASGGTTIFWQDPQVSDNSDHGVDVVLQTHSKGDFFQIGVTTVTYVYEDKSRNLGQCSFNVSVRVQVDFTPPVVNSCPTDIFRTIQFSSSGVFVNWTEPTATDDTTEYVTVLSNKRPSEFFLVGVTNVTYTFSDEEENKAYCFFNVNITQGDILPPTIHDCPDNISIYVESGAESANVEWVEPIVEDESGDVISTSNYQPGSTFLPGVTAVRYNFTDSHGNAVSCIFFVHVGQDTIPPVVNCPNNVSVQVPLGAEGRSVDWPEPTAMDQSGDVIVLVQSHNPGQFFTVGNTVVTYIFQDSSANNAFCSFHVSVEVLEEDRRLSPLLFASAGGGAIILFLFIVLSICCCRLKKRRRRPQSEDNFKSLDNKASTKIIKSVEKKEDDDNDWIKEAHYDVPTASRRYSTPLPDRGRYSKRIIVPSSGTAETSFSNGEPDYMDPELLFQKRDLHYIIQGIDQ
ncbi:Hyalin [Holothuria leucospilota]|uniref:Hyalin n=1 Tax=Holothuria leucospilota TaxID=206669 RepID=A0A9Q1BG03_HOLLE|nr:Hyalin [Holothuria leucospilota]